MKTVQIKRAFRILLCGALAFSPLAASADELDNQKAAAEQEAAQLKQERAELEKQLEGTTEKLQKAVLALHDVEKRIPAAKAALADAQTASQAAEREVADLAQRLADAETELAAVQQMRVENQVATQEAHRLMAASARQAARGDQLTVVGMITGAQSASDFVRQSTVTAAVARAQARTVAEIQDADAAARNTEARINAISQQIAQLKADAEVAFEQRQAAEQAAINQQNEVANLYKKQSELAAEIEDQRDAELQEIEDNKADQEAIAQTIRELQAQQAERDRIIEEKRRQEAADRQAKLDFERKAQEEAYQKALADYETAKKNYDASQLDYETALAEYQKAQQAYDACVATATAALAGQGEGTTTEGNQPASGTPGESCAPLAPKPLPPAPTPPTPPVSPPPIAPAPALNSGSFLGWPTDNHTVTSSYGWRMHPTLHVMRLHAGVDLRAQCGAPIYAAQSGIVVKREWYGTGGNMILIDHGKDNAGANIMTRYLHLSSYNVALNQWVAKGQVIGYSGMTGGVSTGCHLHFEVYVNGSHVDPMTKLP